MSLTSGHDQRMLCMDGVQVDPDVRTSPVLRDQQGPSVKHHHKRERPRHRSNAGRQSVGGVAYDIA